MSYKVELGWSILTDKDELIKKEHLCENCYIEGSFVVLEKSNQKIYIHTSELDYFIVSEVKE